MYICGHCYQIKVSHALLFKYFNAQSSVERNIHRFVSPCMWQADSLVNYFYRMFYLWLAIFSGATYSAPKMVSCKQTNKQTTTATVQTAWALSNSQTMILPSEQIAPWIPSYPFQWMFTERNLAAIWWRKLSICMCMHVDSGHNASKLFAYSQRAIPQNLIW